MRWLTAGLLVVVVLACGCSDDGAGGQPREATSSPDTTTSIDTTTTEPPTAPQPVPTESAVVMAGPSGVQIVSPDGTSTSVATDPAAAAFGIGSDLVVFQNAEQLEASFPLSAAGAVQVWTGGETRTLPIDPNATRTFLLDAAMVDNAPFALVVETLRGVGPDDTFEALVQINLRDDTRTMIVRRPSWESGHYAARFLTDGDVVGLFSSEAHILLARWSATSGEALWTEEIGFDIQVDLALRDGEVTLIQPSFDAGRGFTPVLTVSRRDPATGSELSSDSVQIGDPAGEIATGLFCRDWTSRIAIACGRAGGAPIVASLADGSFQSLPGEPGAIPTLVRPS